METDKITFITDAELKKKLKIIAAKNDTTITNILNDFIRLYVSENE